MSHFHHILNLSERRSGFDTRSRTPVHHVVKRSHVVDIRWDMHWANHLQKLFISDFLISVGVDSPHDGDDLLVRREMSVQSEE